MERWLAQPAHFEDAPQTEVQCGRACRCGGREGRIMIECVVSMTCVEGQGKCGGTNKVCVGVGEGERGSDMCSAQKNSTTDSIILHVCKSCLSKTLFRQFINFWLELLKHV